MGIKIMGNASKIFWVYIAYMVITVVLIGLFGKILPDQTAPTAGRRADHAKTGRQRARSN